MFKLRGRQWILMTLVASIALCSTLFLGKLRLSHGLIVQSGCLRHLEPAEARTPSRE